MLRRPILQLKLNECMLCNSFYAYIKSEAIAKVLRIALFSFRVCTVEGYLD